MRLAENNFGDPLETEPKEEVSAKKIEEPVAQQDGMRGLPASPGVAVGPVFILKKEQLVISNEKITEKQIRTEKQFLDEAIGAGVAELQKIVTHTKGEAADILSTQIMVAKDPELRQRAHNLIEDEQNNSAWAWQKAVNESAEAIAMLDDPYLQQRAGDIRDVGYRVLRQLVATDQTTRSQIAELKRPVILVADELFPSDTADIDLEKVLGIVTLKGTATSHSAILARGLGIPAVVGLGTSDGHALKKADQIGLDGDSGQIWLTPTPKEIADLLAKRKRLDIEKGRLQKESQAEANTKDGKRIEIMANIRNPAGAARALTYGAEGVGLFRIEFLFMEGNHAPTEDEQYAAYVEAADNLNGRPLTIRTLDVGGDKPIDYIDIPPEENPFLGWRGIRYCLDNPEFFKVQLRAICRASADYPISIMFPMISTLDELLRAKAYLAESQAELTDEGIRFDPEMHIGVMIEVPSAVFVAEQLAKHVDFFSIGTNDLTQYTMAADRGNFQVSSLSDPLQPSVLRAIVQVAYAAHLADITLAMCGEMAGNPLAIPLLLGLGITEFSMSSPAIPKAKEVVSNTSMTEVQAIADAILDLEHLDEVEAFLAQSE